MENSSKYGLHSKLTAKTSQGAILTKILLEAATLMENAKGCQLYMVSLEEDNADVVWVTEIWDNKEDHDNSLDLPE